MDSFSERFTKALLDAFPEWSDLVRQSVREDHLELEIAAPSGKGQLLVSTAGEEVTVGFDRWHQHFNEIYWLPGYEGELNEEPFERVIQFLRDFLIDRVVIRIWTKNGEYAGSSALHLWYSSNDCRGDCLGDHYSLKSWSGRGDLPSTPINPDELRKYFQSLEPRSNEGSEGRV